MVRPGRQFQIIRAHDGLDFKMQVPAGCECNKQRQHLPKEFREEVEILRQAEAFEETPCLPFPGANAGLPVCRKADLWSATRLRRTTVLYPSRARAPWHEFGSGAPCAFLLLAEINLVSFLED